MIKRALSRSFDNPPKVGLSFNEREHFLARIGCEKTIIAEKFASTDLPPNGRIWAQIVHLGELM
jgi:hypothetical protein